MRAAIVLMIVLLLAGCANKPPPPADSATATSTHGLTPSSSSLTSASDVQTAYDRAQRILKLLANCTTAGAAASALQQAQNGLGAILAGTTPNTPDNRTQAVDAMLSAQASAYTAALACGLVAPNVPDPGGWDATWWDVSSED